MANNTTQNTSVKSFEAKIWLAYKAFVITAVVSLVIYLLGLTADIDAIAIVSALVLIVSLLGLLTVSAVGAVKSKHIKQIIFIVTVIVVFIITIAAIANFIGASAPVDTIESIQ